MEINRLIGAVIVIVTLLSCEGKELPTSNIIMGADREYDMSLTHMGDSQFKITFSLIPGQQLNYTHEEWVDFMMSRTERSTDYMKNLGYEYFDEEYFDCAISDEIMITSDMAIEDIAAGENLIDILELSHFSHFGLICSFPDIEPIGFAKVGMPLKEYLAEGNTLPLFHDGFYLGFEFKQGVGLPESFKLSVDIPIHGLNYADRPWEGGEWTYIDKVLHGDVDVNTK